MPDRHALFILRAAESCTRGTMSLNMGEYVRSPESCVETSESKQCLDDHPPRPSGKGILTCGQCSKKFIRINDLRKHELEHAGEKPFSCGQCPYKFSRRIALIIHLRRRHTDKKSRSCHVCSEQFCGKAELSRHVMTHTVEKPFACETCERTFAYRSDFENHLRTHTGEKPFACETCGRRFAVKHNLSQHMRTHTGEKPFSCETCHMSFARKNTLQNHQKTHSDKGAFVCETCQKSFSRRHTLKNHQAKHCGEEERRFAPEQNLEHLERNHTTTTISSQSAIGDERDSDTDFVFR